MKHIIKKTITMMLAIVVAMGIMSFERKRVDAETKSLAVGTEYYFDDSIDFDGKWITLGYGIGAGTKAVSGVYPFHEITYNAETKWWQIVFSRGPGDFVFLYFHDSSYTGEENVKGIKCVDGEGTEENPFIFELIIENTPADDPEPDEEIITEVKVNVTPPKCGVSITSGVGWSTPSPEVEYSGNYALLQAYYTNGYMPFNGTYAAGDDFYIDISFYPKDTSLVDGSDVVISLNEGIEILDDDYVNDDVFLRFMIKGKVGSDCEVEPDPTPTPEPDPTPNPTPVPIPKTGIDAPDSYALFRNIGLLGVCLIGSVLFITKKK